MTLIDGITSRSVQTPRLRANVLERAGDREHGGPVVVFIHGNVSSSLFWQDTMLSAPEHWRVFAIDLRGFGDSETLPVDATRGLRDFSDDVASVVAEMGLGSVHVVAWSMGAGVALQYALDHPVRSLTLQSPVSPYGFGGTRGDGSRLTDDDAGCGGGGANPDFVAHLESGDTSSDSQASPRAVYASSYVVPGFVSEHEDIWVESMLSTKTGVDNYPGDGVPSENWPGFAAGTRGVLNTMAPRYLDLSGIVDLEPKPPLTWIHGANDLIVSDTSYFDLNYLGELGVIPGWPGAEVAPAQPMVTQTRRVFEAYASAGGTFQELVLENCGHSPHLEYPEAFRDALVATVEAAGGE
ncbi:alpha/beta fold hydrolase [Diaminobutyricibacter sp. McL0618]|uniref:alpha/beta fold hydrolase n=1 Tax=Leifsonia sp. McL0618 TaxID=3415677 RepID=UPI003CEFEAD4